MLNIYYLLDIVVKLGEYTFAIEWRSPTLSKSIEDILFDECVRMSPLIGRPLGSMCLCLGIPSTHRFTQLETRERCERKHTCRDSRYPAKLAASRMERS